MERDTAAPDRRSASHRRRRRAVAWLVVAHACVDVVMLVGGYLLRFDFSLLVFSGLAFCVSQAALLGLWFAFGRRQSPRRLVACALLLLVIAFVLVSGVYARQVWDTSLSRELSGLIAAQFIAVTLTAFVLKRTGLAVAWANELPDDGAAARLQLTMFDLFALTALVALLTTGLLALRRWLDGRYEFDIIAPLTLAVAVATLPVMVAALARIRLVWRLFAAALIASLAIPLYFAFSETWFGVFIVGVVAGLELMSLLVVRLAGYRLFVRDRPNGTIQKLLPRIERIGR